jgi:hypothetical protein
MWMWSGVDVEVERRGNAEMALVCEQLGKNVNE